MLNLTRENATKLREGLNHGIWTGLMDGPSIKVCDDLLALHDLLELCEDVLDAEDSLAIATKVRELRGT